MKSILLLILAIFGSWGVAQDAEWTTDVRASAGVIYSLAKDVSFEGSGVNLTGGSEPQFGLIVSAGKFLPGRFGFDVALTYEFEREVSGSDMDFAVTVIAANGNYMFANNLFLRGGLNFALLSLDSPSTDADGGIGYQAGLGYVWDRLTFTAEYRWLSAQGKYDDGTTSADLDKIHFNGAVLGAQYTFN